MRDNFSVTTVDVRAASEDTYVSMYVFANLMRKEKLPDDPPIPFEDYRNNFKNIPDDMDVYKWLVRRDGTDVVIASGNLVVAHDGRNPHIAEASIFVLPQFRRRGLARNLLQKIAEIARAERRTLLTSDTSESIPAGESFLARIGAERALESHVNQLDVANLNSEIIESWIIAFPSSEFEIHVVRGAYAEEDLANISALFNIATKSTPRGSLNQEAHSFTPTQLRQFEKHMLAGGTERWTVFVCHRATGAYVGLTEAAWRPGQPGLLEQRSTAVHPNFRRKGLARVLKATLLARLLTAHPEIEFVRTENADSNAPMLAINTALGFKPYMTATTWQIETDKVFDYLQCTMTT